MLPDASAPSRHVFCADALAWLAEHSAEPQTSVVTSLPDLSELPALALDAWQEWFQATVSTIVRWLPPAGVAIFFQSDIVLGPRWVDKGHLVQCGAERAGGVLLWHRIVCRRPPDTASLGRASYSHLLCIARELPAARPTHAAAHVLSDAGPTSWSRGMGQAACRAACRYLRDETDTRRIVDPFCGQGALLAIANELGFDAIGVELSAKRCRAARRAGVDEI